MKPIIQLDQNLINKIAAGEVVERPLNVVKELTENAIDAGATAITVEITDGGLAMVRITDNGSGIAAEDLLLAFSRHATSKIECLDDLFSVQTLGFRGEALSSISSVSQVEMVTKTPHAVTGTRVEIHGGQVIAHGEVGCANGTTIVVSNLFYNTPARRKFLKKPATEAGYISDCMERLALGNPSLTLRYINNGKIIFQSNGNGDLKSVMLNIYGREVASKVIPIDTKDLELHLYGLVGKPEVARGNRAHSSLFINGRYIQSKLLSNAIESAMKTMLPQGKFPIFALNLRMPYDALDVNVHPTKMEVRFADEDRIYNFVEDAVRVGLSEQNLIPSMTQTRPRRGGGNQHSLNEQLPLTSESFAPPDEWHSRSPERGFIPREAVGFGAEPHLYEEPLSERELATLYIDAIKNPTLEESFLPNSKGLNAKEKSNFDFSVEEKQVQKNKFNFQAKQAPFSSHKNDFTDFTPTDDIETTENVEQIFTNHTIIGQIFDTYWLISHNDSLFLIDQHAAHERILYEELLNSAAEKTMPSQQLLLPLPLHLTAREKQTLQDNIEHFNNFGFTIISEDDTFSIQSVPMLIKGTLQTGFFSDLLDKMGQAGFATESAYHHKTELIAMASCKAAVKGGDNMAEAEAKALVAQLMALENPFTCPHGRPTIVELTRQELERRFKRS